LAFAKGFYALTAEILVMAPRVERIPDAICWTKKKLSHVTWDRCYDHNFHNFLRFFANFQQKTAFFSKTNVKITFSATLPFV
jgi:hypothetical protein